MEDPLITYTRNKFSDRAGKGPTHTNVSQTFRSDELHEVSCCYSGGPGTPYFQPVMECSCGFSSGRCENWQEAGEAMDEHITEIREKAK